jgi:hypothetical protein
MTSATHAKQLGNELTLRCADRLRSLRRHVA